MNYRMTNEKLTAIVAIFAALVVCLGAVSVIAVDDSDAATKSYSWIGVAGSSVTINVGDTLTLTDNGDDELSVTINSKPSWTSFSNDILTGTATSSGTYTLSFYLNDTSGEGMTGSHSTTITVNPTTTTHSYTLIYNANGGSGAPSSQTATSTSTSKTFTISSTEPTRDGYLFDGWATSSTATSGYYGTNTSTITLTISSGTSVSKTLYAVWIEDVEETYTYTLTYDTNSGTPSISTQTATTTALYYDFTISSVSPTLTNYVFLGWSLTTDYAIGSGSASYYPGDTIRITTSLGLHAVWEADLDFGNPDAITGISGSTVTYTPSTTLSTCTFTLSNNNASWLSISNSTVSGTAPTVTTMTEYTATITATSPGGQTATQTITIQIYPIAQLTASPDRIVDCTLGESITTTTISGNVECTFEYSGDLPDGVTFTSGVFDGTPTTCATYSIVVTGTATEGPEQLATITVVIGVTEPTLEITSTAPTSLYIEGSSYSYSLSYTENLTVTWTITGCDWLAVSNDTVVGSINGIDADQTTVIYIVTATSLGGQVVDQTVTINVEAVLQFTSVPTASCIVIPVYSYNADGSIVSADTVNVITYKTSTYRFVFIGENAETVSWDFGDGSTGSGFSIVHTYKNSGTYTYTCTATNELGSDETTGTIVINDAGAGLDWFLVGLIVLSSVCSVVTIQTKIPTIAFFTVGVLAITAGYYLLV